MNKIYDEKFFDDRVDALISARVIVPIVMRQIKPKSVVDVGCGNGEFLQIFRENGVSEIFGIEGPWLRKERLRIPKKFFQYADLEMPLNIEKKFDLAVSLEVAEHLSVKSAEQFIESLTNLAPIVLFSAAIPLQGGTYHQNEQWPEYWAKLFYDRGYVPVDSIRRKIWANKKVCVWYKQNILLFIKKDALHKYRMLDNQQEGSTIPSLSVVHPDLYLSKVRGFTRIANLVPSQLKAVVGKLLKI